MNRRNICMIPVKSFDIKQKIPLEPYCSDDGLSHLDLVPVKGDQP